MDVIKNLNAIDEHVYEAMSTLAGERLDTIGDLRKHLTGWDSVNVGDSLPAGATSKLAGHLAEPIVAAHIEGLGIQVDMPTVSNQPLYDLILEGDIAVNVKAVASGSSLASHFAKYPKTPVIVPADMEGLSNEAIQLNATDSLAQLERAVELEMERIMLVDPGLAHADVLEQVENVTDGLLANVDPVSFPLITLAVSGYRECRLLRQQETNVPAAIKNLSWDVAGTVAGAKAGASGGALIGTAIAPGIGTVAGALLCGMVGAIGGRYLTNLGKYGQLRKAIKKYMGVLQKAKEDAKIIACDLQSQADHALSDQKAIFAREAITCRRELERAYAHLHRQRRSLNCISPEKAQSLLNGTLPRLQGKRRAFKRIMSWPYWIQRILTNKSSKLPKERVADVDELITQLQDGANKIREIPAGEEGCVHATVRFLQLLLNAGHPTEDIRALVREHEMRRKALAVAWAENVKATVLTLADHRFCFGVIVTHTLRQLRDGSERRVRKIRENLEPVYQRVEDEMARLGKGRTAPRRDPSATAD